MFMVVFSTFGTVFYIMSGVSVTGVSRMMPVLEIIEACQYHAPWNSVCVCVCVCMHACVCVHMCGVVVVVVGGVCVCVCVCACALTLWLGRLTVRSIAMQGFGQLCSYWMLASLGQLCSIKAKLLTGELSQYNILSTVVLTMTNK